MSAFLSFDRVARDDALAYVFDAYDGVTVRPGKGLPHARAVTDILQQAGYDEGTQLIGLLHDVVEDTPRTVDDVRVKFGDRVGGLVGALTEDPAIRHYAQRKRDLRARTMAAGSPAVEVALADKIASLHEALATESRPSDRKLRHYHSMLQLALGAALAPVLTEQLQQLLARIAAAG